MKTVKFSGISRNAFGRVLETPVPFSGEREEYENIGEIRAANDYPSDAEIVKMRNGERAALATSAARASALEAAGVKAPAPTDPIVVFAGYVKNQMAAGRSLKKATKKAWLDLGYNAEGFECGPDGVSTGTKATAKTETDEDE